MPRIRKTTEKQVKKKSSTKKERIVVINPKGEEIERVAIESKIKSSPVSTQLLAQYVRVFRANQRQGTKSTKTRADVVGSTKKIYRQKGTGRARHGPIKAPIFVGGGVAHGPHPTDFSLKLNKKQKVKAFSSAFSLRYKSGDIIVVEGATSKSGKTKEFVSFLKNSALQKVPITFVYKKETGKAAVQSARNIPSVSLVEVQSLSAYDLLRTKKIVFTKDAFDVINNKLA